APEESASDHGPDKGEDRDSSLAGRISRLVGQVLEGIQIDPKANLLTYGANSIDMVRIGNALEKEFGSRPRMDQLFRLQTVEALAQYYNEHIKPAAQAQPSAESEVALGGELSQLISSYRVLLDPVERDAFKATQPGIRPIAAEETTIELNRPVLDEGL